MSTIQIQSAAMILFLSLPLSYTVVSIVSTYSPSIDIVLANFVITLCDSLDRNYYHCLQIGKQKIPTG